VGGYTGYGRRLISNELAFKHRQTLLADRGFGTGYVLKMWMKHLVAMLGHGRLTWCDTLLMKPYLKVSQGLIGTYIRVKSTIG
jgi:hypothetical protein